MSKYDLIVELLGQVPIVVSTYFHMLVSGDQSSITGAVLGFLGLGYMVFKIVKRFWFKLFLNTI